MTDGNLQRARWFINLLGGAYALGLTLFFVLRLLLGDSLWWLAFFGNFTPFYFAPLIVLLPLALLLRSRRTVLFLLPFALIGGLWFGPLYLPKTAAAAPDASMLRVVTFNVWGDNPNLSRIEDWLRQQDADVAITIETPSVWSAGVPALTDIYPDQRRVDTQGVYWDSAILSQHPVLSSEQFDLGDGEIPQQRAIIEIDGRQIAVYSIHLYLPVGAVPRLSLPVNYYTRGVFGYDDTSRNTQIRNLIGRLKDEPLPYIVAGDFNMSDQTSIYGDLAAVMGDSFREAGRGLGASWPVVQALGFPGLIPPLVRIDYIWHSDEFRALEAAQGPYLGSDHLPLYANLALNSG